MSQVPHPEAETGATCGTLSPQDGVLRQRLRVADVTDREILLAGVRTTGCSGCAARTGCGAAALADALDADNRIRLPRSVPVAVGDEVVVAMHGRAFLGAAARAYLLPSCALAGAAAIAVVFNLPDAATAALCLPALALSLLPLHLADRRERSNSALWIEKAVDAPDGQG